MQVKLKSNRRFLINICLPGLIIGILATGILTCGLFFAKDINDDILPSFLVVIILTNVFLVIILVILLTPKPSFEFDQKLIKIIKNKKTVIIKVEDIAKMVYYKYKWHYIFTMYFNPIPDGGCMKIHITDKSGNKYFVGFISYKDAKSIQQIYPNLLKIL